MLYAALASALLTSMLLVAAFSGYGPSAPNLRWLSGREQNIVGAAADAMFPPGGPIPLSGTDAGVVGYFDAYVGRQAPAQRFLVHLMLTFVELSPVIFGPERGRFSKLGHPAQLRFLDGMAKSGIYFRRVVFVSLRAMLTMAYLADARVARAMNMVADRDPFGLGAKEAPAIEPSGPRLRAGVVIAEVG